MLRFKIRELLAEKCFQEKRRITIKEVSAETGISKPTLNRILNQFGYVTGTDNILLLCRYFDCEVGELISYIRTED